MAEIRLDLAHDWCDIDQANGGTCDGNCKECTLTIGEDK